MKFFAPILLLLSNALGLVSPAFAEQRILLSFDNSGHHVQKIIRIENSLSQAPNATLIQDAAGHYLSQALAGMQAGSATLLWLDAQGNWFPKSTEPDPRIFHAPSHIRGANKSKVGELAGAWLVSGPSRAARLIILLPRDATLGLGFEQWDVTLAE